MKNNQPVITTEEMHGNCPFSEQECDKCQTQACTKPNPEAYITTSWIDEVTDQNMWG